ncbi:hypothetical protein [Bradyrhizobium cenepequi]|uniref:hypothetical protein n=1 Tax=Bradyrhizobium cenepequi TaxID=2821403 RepID=UPI001CE2E90B|nr:hypothetical protein [Bradyrhizobium cenepequi]MCA6108138.1 hypothetical protein [Bradyrhizobium cenepequi]
MRQENETLRNKEDDTMTLTQELAASLARALRYIEVSQAYRGAMTPAEVEAAIIQNRDVATAQIAANSVTTLASFNLHKARELIAKAEASQ